MAKKKQTQLAMKYFGGGAEVERETRIIPLPSGSSEMEQDGVALTVTDSEGKKVTIWLLPGEARTLSNMLKI
jgi:hypothetical protein